VNSQRFTQGEIDNFDVCVRVVVCDAILEVLNNDVIFAGNRRIKQASLELLHLLMQQSPCSDKAMQSLETFFRFSNLRTSKPTLFGWTTTMASSNERSSSKSLKSLLLIRSQYGWIIHWIPHNAGFGFLDIAGPALGVFASLDRL
jgi:hypothetical protein